MTQTQLQTIITQVKRAVYSRLLVYVDNDLENQTIIPIYFLSMHTKNGTPTLTNQDKKNDPNDADYQRNVFETWKNGNKHPKQLWKSWRENY